MNLQELQESLPDDTPPAELEPLLQALWYDVKGDWDRAHRIVQDIAGVSAAWVHAYLHRKEGDSWNADYWYSRAGRVRSSLSLEAEWEEIAVALLATQDS